jgi:ATP-dependent Clp protease ATP-binding subunit ClpA
MGLLNAGREMRTIKNLLSGAERESRRGGDDLPGAEHLLVAAVDLPDGTAARALGRFGIDADSLRAALEQVHADALAGAGVQAPGPVDAAADVASLAPASGVFRSTPQAQQVFRDAVALSKSSTPSRLLGAHVVAAVCALEHGTAARALSALGLDRSDLRAAALDEADAAR